MLTRLDLNTVSSLAASPAMRKVCDQIILLAKLNAPVLILGEAGTGKETTARLLHGCSPRRERRFRSLSCTGVAAQDVEKELFGFTDRSFPATICERPGTLEFCQGGVLFLEDIGELPLSIQSNLLHAMEEKQYIRPGSDTEVKVDVRILAGTKPDLDAALATGKIRADFYFHLSTFTIHLPTLRQRREDIPLLLEHFMSQWAVKYVRSPVRFTSAAIDACMAYSWPGNIVELENFVKRYLIIGDEALALSDLGAAQEKRNGSLPQNGMTEPARRDQQQSLTNLVRQLKDEAEIEQITKALQETQWNRQAAARRLKISYRGLLYKIQHYQLRPPDSVRPNYPGDSI